MTELKYKGHTIKIKQDTDPQDPREWDNGCVMVCEHRRYTLGDNQYSNDYADNWKEWFAEYIMKELSPVTSKHYDEEGYLDEVGVKKIWKWIETNLVVSTLRLYDHSGISMSTSGAYPFNCQWDSGQVGYAYITKAMMSERIAPMKNWTKKLRERASELIDAEVKEYSQYLEEDVVGYMVFNPDDPNCENCDESCWGYYSEEDAIAEAKGIVDYNVKQARLKRFAKLKELIKAKVNVLYRKIILEEIQYQIFA